MLYAQISKSHYPLGWEEVEYLSTELASYRSGYQTIFEIRLFGAGDADMYKFSVVKWNEQPLKHARDREVLFESHDKGEFTGMLRLFLGIAKDAHAAQTHVLSKSIYEMYRRS